MKSVKVSRVTRHIVLFVVASTASGCVTLSSIDRIKNGVEQSSVAVLLPKDDPIIHWKATRRRLFLEPFTTSVSGSSRLVELPAGCRHLELLTNGLSGQLDALSMESDTYHPVGNAGDLTRKPPTLARCQVVILFTPDAGGSGSIVAYNLEGWTLLARVPPEHSTAEPLLWLNLSISPIADVVATPGVFLAYMIALFTSLAHG